VKLIVGLGNPGGKYAGHRHNVGFMAVDRLVDAHGFGVWRERFNGLLAEGRIGSSQALLLKPTTMMNQSGQSVGAAMRYHKIEPSDLIVLHDELDVAAGKVKVKTGGGHAGHNGLRSIDQHIGPDYVRVRIGIGHPGDKRLVSHHVLSDFSKADRDWLEPLLDAVAACFPVLAEGDQARFATDLARRLEPPAEGADKAPAKSLLRRLMDRLG
jgi:PTH1 family peptidyl-tRNA hydrolase